ncbi:MAG: winged helix-turn-helix domain-containing protein [candidate division NC10 bacterium]|nr:winged helix-turn-helix domain-containing protein [candidate division NC10 bacterium]
MREDIGDAAGKVWQYLEAQGSRSASQIQRDTRLSQSLTYLALGWLAREGKVRFAQDRRALLVSLDG